MKKIGVLSYPVKHRKTFDVLSLLRAKGYKDVIVYAIPFHYKKKRYPLVDHRPELVFDIPDIELLCKNFDYKCEIGMLDTFSIENDRILIIAGAGILSEDFVRNHTIINSHPGYIPNCRGLDAFKWAIVENEPIGVTTHLIGKYVDAGWVIERRMIPLNKYDTFHSVAQRVYENEVSMLVEAIELFDKGELEMIHPDGYEVHKRMPEETERELLVMFEKYKNLHIV